MVILVYKDKFDKVDLRFGYALECEFDISPPCAGNCFESQQAQLK